MAQSAERVDSSKDWPWLAVISAVRVVRWLVLAVVAVLLAALLLSQFDGARKFPLTLMVYQARAVIMDTLGEGLRQNLPTRIGGRDRTDWILIVLALAMSLVAGRIGDTARKRIFLRQMDEKVASLRAGTGLKAGSVLTRELEEKVKTLKSASKGEREELLRIYAETKRKLDGMGRELAFLSIDVVGSTAMKGTEDSATAQIDFAEYRKMVEAIFNANGVIKAAWTPDGVMACFSNIDTAVRAGQSVINSLQRFNREVKLMKADFAVRCGVNSGFIYLDDATPLEHVSDRVIDIAGHMQKYAEPNTVAVAKTVIKPMGDLGGFVATNKVVDGLEVYSWMPHAAKPS